MICVFVAVAFVQASLAQASFADDDSKALPAWCFNPPGDDCRFYRECLAARYSCEAATDSYALGFGEVMCNTFTTKTDEFSEPGRQWIDRARVCLQKKLVPVLAANQSQTCPEIKKFAFHTHVECYSERIQGNPSFCDLPFNDWLRVTWIVKGVIIHEAGETLSQAMQIFGRCASRNRILGLLG